MSLKGRVTHAGLLAHMCGEQLHGRSHFGGDTEVPRLLTLDPPPLVKNCSPRLACQQPPPGTGPQERGRPAPQLINRM